jgi:hemolysin III
VSPGEEIANSVTHGLGALLSIAGLIALMVRAVHGSTMQLAACAIYGISLVLLYVSSTLFHALPNKRAKRFFLLLDHISIYLLIAGTYTPLTLVTLRGPWGWRLFGFIWTLALGGILYRCLRGLHVGMLSFAVYGLMGWSVLAVTRPLLHAMPVRGLEWLVAGAITYSVGIAFYVSRRKYSHAVWHLFVVGGSVCHYLMVYRYVLTVQ